MRYLLTLCTMCLGGATSRSGLAWPTGASSLQRRILGGGRKRREDGAVTIQGDACRRRTGAAAACAAFEGNGPELESPPRCCKEQRGAGVECHRWAQVREPWTISLSSSHHFGEDSAGFLPQVIVHVPRRFHAAHFVGDIFGFLNLA